MKNCSELIALNSDVKLMSLRETIREVKRHTNEWRLVNVKLKSWYFYDFVKSRSVAHH